MSVLSRLFGREDGCAHESIVYAPGNCTYDDVHLREGQVTTYRPFYRECMDCGETLYNQRYTADGTETSLGEPIKSTEIPRHVTDDYLRGHHRNTEDL